MASDLSGLSDPFCLFISLRSVCSLDHHTLCFSQRQQEGDLMRFLSSKVKHLPVAVVSAVVLESTARFGDDPVLQLLSPQSAISHLLCHGKLSHDRP